MATTVLYFILATLMQGGRARDPNEPVLQRIRGALGDIDAHLARLADLVATPSLQPFSSTPETTDDYSWEDGLTTEMHLNETLSEDDVNGDDMAGGSQVNSLQNNVTLQKGNEIGHTDVNVTTATDDVTIRGPEDDYDYETLTHATTGPTTEGPTTGGPTTDGPTTDGPTTDGPTTNGPLTDGPTNDTTATADDYEENVTSSDIDTTQSTDALTEYDAEYDTYEPQLNITDAFQENTTEDISSEQEITTEFPDYNIYKDTDELDTTQHNRSKRFYYEYLTDIFGSGEDEQGRVRRSEENGPETSGLYVHCTPSHPPQEDDICSRLLHAMWGVGNVTMDISKGIMTEATAKEAESLAEVLKEVVDEAEEEEVFREGLDMGGIIGLVGTLREAVSGALDEVSGALVRLNNASPTLVLVLAVVGAAIILALIVVALFSIRKRKAGLRAAEARKINSCNIPVQSFKESLGHDNPAFCQDTTEVFPRSSSAPPPSTRRCSSTSIPRPRSYYEESPTHDHHHSNKPMGSLSKPLDNGRSPSPYYSVPRPLGNSLGHGGVQGHEEEYDPYSLEQRAPNIRRIHSGRLMRIEP